MATITNTQAKIVYVMNRPNREEIANGDEGVTGENVVNEVREHPDTNGNHAVAARQNLTVPTGSWIAAGAIGVDGVNHVLVSDVRQVTEDLEI